MTHSQFCIQVNLSVYISINITVWNPIPSFQIHWLWDGWLPKSGSLVLYAAPFYQHTLQNYFGALLRNYPQWTTSHSWQNGQYSLFSSWCWCRMETIMRNYILVSQRNHSLSQPHILSEFYYLVCCTLMLCELLCAFTDASCGQLCQTYMAIPGTTDNVHVFRVWHELGLKQDALVVETSERSQGNSHS